MVVCRHTRFVDAIPMRTATTEECAEALLHSWISRHGVSSACTSDNGVEFVASLWKEMSKKLGIQLQYTPTYTPQANGLVERQNSTIKTSLKTALIQMGEQYKEEWYNFLPWILLMKRVAFQNELKTSPAFLAYGMNLSIPGDLLRDPGSPYTEPELKELVRHMHKTNEAPPIPTRQPHQEIVPEPPQSITHVYTKQHKTVGLEPSYAGPFEILSRPSRTQVVIKVGLTKSGEVRTELRHWKDLKVAHMRPEAKEAQRPKRGRPAKQPTSTRSEADCTTGVDPQIIQDGAEINKPSASNSRAGNSNARSTLIPSARPSHNIPSMKNSAGNSNRPARSTRNPDPKYVDALTLQVTGPPASKPFANRTWSASAYELEQINKSINARRA